jgi:serine/threonine protein kinase
MESRTTLRKLELPYESVRTLYEGTSEVRVCRNDLTGAVQVVKGIDTLGLDEAVAVREATLLQEIAHDNVVRVLEVALNPSYPPPMKVIEMIMPYYERGSVYDALERGERFTLSQSVRIVVSALRGLAELHDNYRVLHRDVKSPNVFLADDATIAKVGDLGLAAPMESDGTSEAHPTAHLWTAPEVYSSRRVDRRSDLYGMGLVFLEMLSGPFPYGDYTRSEIVDRLSKGRPGLKPRHMSFAVEIPRQIRTVVRKSTAVDPEGRFSRAQEMEAALGRIRFIDWGKVSEEDDSVVWEGDTVQQRGRRYRIEARRRKRAGGWRLSGLQLVNRWQRIVPDHVVSGLDSTESSVFFERMVRLATRR